MPAGEFTKYETRGAYHWDEIAERRPNAYAARRHALYAFFVDEVRRRRPRHLVDVGCGDAALTHLMAEATPGRATGVEPEPAGVELARQALARAGSKATVVQGDGEALPFDDRSVDLVALCEVIEHIEAPDHLLGEIARVLEPQGTLLLSTPQWQKPELRPFHVKEYRGPELAELLSGFFSAVEVHVSERGGLQDLYQSNRWARVALNVVSELGANPFAIRRPATPGRAAWRQLTAVCTGPR
jgi:SAM-dependent methyltransferase